ncbi:MAG: hypothetical protein HYV47_01560 [Candidatus Nealsonbacteria bacterium]|nr:hypothetical protein [Candidatus Nealsonbacteria bacterium]
MTKTKERGITKNICIILGITACVYLWMLMGFSDHKNQWWGWEKPWKSTEEHAIVYKIVSILSPSPYPYIGNFATGNYTTGNTIIPPDRKETLEEPEKWKETLTNPWDPVNIPREGKKKEPPINPWEKKILEAEQ